MREAAGASDAAVADDRLRAGLFGKLPAYGDFVRRGWSDETVESLDRWLSDGMVLARVERDEEAFAAWWRGALLWRGYVPPGKLGPAALHLGVAPSVDRVGRLFPLVLGVTGETDAVWAHARGAGGAIDDAMYDTLAGADAEAALAAVGGSAGPGDVSPPERSTWWFQLDDFWTVESEAVDGALLLRLWGDQPSGAATG